MVDDEGLLSLTITGSTELTVRRLIDSQSIDFGRRYPQMNDVN